MQRASAVSVPLFVATVIATAGFGAVRNRAFYHDDAFISLRYARNLLAGDGLTWNPGERIEGYSNFLHVIAVSGLGALGVDLVPASRILSALAFLALLGLLAVSFGRLRSWKPAEVLAWGLVGGSLPLVVWIWGGLEGPLFTLLCALGCAAFLRSWAGVHPWRDLVVSGIALGLAVLTRPDGLLFAVVVAGFILWTPAGSAPQRGRCLAVFGAAFAVIVVPYLLWKITYFGELLPNTFHVKASGIDARRVGQGLRYVGRWMVSPPWLPLLFLAALAIEYRRRTLDRATLFLAVAAIGYATFVVAIGGDHMRAHRLLLPAIPLMAWTIARCLRTVMTGPRATALLLLPSAAAIGLQTADAALNPRVMDHAAFVGSIVGRYIDVSWPSGSLVALNTAGSTPYFAPKMRFLDMLGLNDRHIARRGGVDIVLPGQELPGHEKGDGAYVLSRVPDYIILGTADGVPADRPCFLSDLELARDPRFAQQYALRRLKLAAQYITGHTDHHPTRRGHLLFTYYERIAAAQSP